MIPPWKRNCFAATAIAPTSLLTHKASHGRWVFRNSVGEKKQTKTMTSPMIFNSWHFHIWFPSVLVYGSYIVNKWIFILLLQFGGKKKTMQQQLTLWSLAITTNNFMIQFCYIEFFLLWSRNERRTLRTKTTKCQNYIYIFIEITVYTYKYQMKNHKNRKTTFSFIFSSHVPRIG